MVAGPCSRQHVQGVGIVIAAFTAVRVGPQAHVQPRFVGHRIDQVQRRRRERAQVAGRRPRRRRGSSRSVCRAGGTGRKPARCPAGRRSARRVRRRTRPAGNWADGGVEPRWPGAKAGPRPKIPGSSGAPRLSWPSRSKNAGVTASPCPRPTGAPRFRCHREPAGEGSTPKARWSSLIPSAPPNGRGGPIRPVDVARIKALVAVAGRIADLGVRAGIEREFQEAIGQSPDREGIRKRLHPEADPAAEAGRRVILVFTTRAAVVIARGIDRRAGLGADIKGGQQVRSRRGPPPGRSG